jgi:hypothetical protein
MAALPVLQSVTQNPVVVPFGGSAAAVAVGRMEDDGVPVGDVSEEATLTVGDATVTVTLTVDVPAFPWSSAVWSDLPAGVSVVNNGGGSFTFSHAG